MAGGFFIHNHFRQAVQGLRAEYHIHIRRAFDDFFALLRSHAAGHANNQVGIFFFEWTHASQIGEYFFLRFFAHGASIKQNNIGLIGLRNLLDAAVFFRQNGQHFFAVVFVHLTTERADKDFFHGLCFLR